jgi:hypothetical protein
MVLARRIEAVRVVDQPHARAKLYRQRALSTHEVHGVRRLFREHGSRLARDGDRQRRQHRKRRHRQEDPGVSDVVVHGQQSASAGHHAHAVAGDLHTVRESTFAGRKHRDRKAVRSDVLRRGDEVEQEHHAEEHVQRRQLARARECGEHTNRNELQRNDPRLPATETFAAVTVDDRSPHELQRPRPRERRGEADVFERMSLFSQEDRQRLREEAKGHALREIERTEQGELRRGGVAHARSPGGNARAGSSRPVAMRLVAAAAVPLGISARAVAASTKYP